MNTRFKYNIYLVAWEIKTYIVYRLYRFSPPHHNRTRDVCLFLRVRSKRTCVCVNLCLILHKPNDDIVYRCITEYACIRHLLVPPQWNTAWLYFSRSVGWLDDFVSFQCNEHCKHTQHTHQFNATKRVPFVRYLSHTLKVLTLIARYIWIKIAATMALVNSISNCSNCYYHYHWEFSSVISTIYADT